MANSQSYSNHGAAALEDGEFWLPPQFLSDDEPSPEERFFSLKFGDVAVGGPFPRSEQGTGWRTSNLSSPGESVVGSADDSDEENLIADLTRKVAQSTLVDGFTPPRSSKGLYPSGSPKSTLCNGWGCGLASSWGNPSGAAQMKSAPPPTLDLLYQAAGKVANMRYNQQRQQIQRVHYLQQQLNHLIQLCDSKPEALSCPYQVSSQHGLPFQPPQASGGGGAKYGKEGTVLSSSAWPMLQEARRPSREPITAKPNGRAAGMRTVFLGSSNVYNRGTAGTGVFLPRRDGAADPEPKRKPGCSTVLIPARVVQALNLNLDEMGSQRSTQPRFDGSFASENDGGWRIRSGRQVSPKPPTGSQHRLQPAAGQETSLPQEWTY